MSAYTDALKRRLRQNATYVGGSRNARLSISAPNPNPRPPNEPKPQQHKGPDNNSKKGNNSGSKSPGHSPSQASAGGGGGRGSAPLPFAPPTDPRDATYWNDLIKLQQNKDFGLQQLGVEQTYANTAFEDALGELARQKPRDILATQENANNAGAFYSSATQENIGRIGQEYFQAESGLRRDKQRADDLRQLSKSMIEQGFSVDQVAAYIAAADRTAQNEINRPAPTSGSALQDLINALKNKNKNKPKPKGNNNGKGGGKGKPKGKGKGK